MFSVQPAIAANGTLTFTPAADANGSATVTVKIHDDGGTSGGGIDTSAPQTFTITVTEVNDTPIADDDSPTTAFNTAVSIDVRANDDPGPANESGQTLTITAFTQGGDGSVAVDGANLKYIPSLDFVGVDTFTYMVCDNGTTNGLPEAKCDTATVTVTVYPGTNGLLATVGSSDADFNHIDGVDVMFTSYGSSKKLAATSPGTFHYELDLKNETGVTLHKKGKKLPPIIRNGVSIADRNGGSVAVIITIPSLPVTPGMPVPPSAIEATNIANSAFKADGWHAVRAHPDDRAEDVDVEVWWTSSAPGGNCYEPSLAWIEGQPDNNAFVKCIKVTGIEIPKHHEAHIHLSLEFGLKGTSGWANNAATAFRAGFPFRSQTQVTLDSDFPIPLLANMTYSGNDVVGLSAAGEQLTAIGGFVFDQNGSGIGAANVNGMTGATIRIYNSAPSMANRCTTTGEVAEYEVDPDGFYFIRNASPVVNVPTSTGNNLPYNIRYYVMVCDVVNVPSAYWPARYIDHKLNYREFEEENFYVSNPTHLAFSVQPINGNRANRTMYTVQVTLLDNWNNVVNDDSTKVTLTKIGGAGGLTGTTTRTMNDGYATFNDLKITASGPGNQLQASDTTGGGSPHPFSPGGIDSNVFTVNP